MLEEFVKFSIFGLPEGLISMIIFSFLITLVLTLLYKKFINKEKYDELKARQKELRQKIKESKNEPEKFAQLQKEMMQASMESMKLTMKPMLITFIPLLLVFGGLKWLYMDLAKIGNIFTWGVNLPIVGNGGGWLFCYIVFSLIFSLILRKKLGL